MFHDEIPITPEKELRKHVLAMFVNKTQDTKLVKGISRSVYELVFATVFCADDTEFERKVIQGAMP